METSYLNSRAGLMKSVAIARGRIFPGCIMKLHAAIMRSAYEASSPLIHTIGSSIVLGHRARDLNCADWVLLVHLPCKGTY